MEHRTYTAKITKTPHGEYIAMASALPGITAFGPTVHEAVESLRETIRRYLEVLALTNIPFPEDAEACFLMKVDVKFMVPAIT